MRNGRGYSAAIADIRTDTSGMDFAAFSVRPGIVRSVLYFIAVIGEEAKNLRDGFNAALQRP
jgi:uncharacterized protein with HEPN domain